MTTPSYAWLAAFLVSVMLAGCQGRPAAQQSSLTETEFFARGLDQYIATGDLQTLMLLPQKYPDGAWAPGAELVIRLAQQKEEKVAGQEQQALLNKRELASCHDEMKRLRQDNQGLQETIDRLKKLLIDMESRSH